MPEGTRLVTGREVFEEVFLGMIMKSRERVRLATANLKNFTVSQGRRRAGIASLLRELCGRGVRTEILHGAVPTDPFLHEIRTGPAFREGSFEMRFCQRVHWKIAVVDYEWLYVGSANLTGAGIGDRSAGSRNFEMGIVTGDESMIDEACSHFDRVWAGEECKACRRKRDCPVPLEPFSF